VTAFRRVPKINQYNLNQYIYFTVSKIEISGGEKRNQDQFSRKMAEQPFDVVLSSLFKKKGKIVQIPQMTSHEKFNSQSGFSSEMNSSVGKNDNEGIS